MLHFLKQKSYIYGLTSKDVTGALSSCFVCDVQHAQQNAGLDTVLPQLRSCCISGTQCTQAIQACQNYFWSKRMSWSAGDSQTRPLLLYTVPTTTVLEHMTRSGEDK